MNRAMQERESTVGVGRLVRATGIPRTDMDRWLWRLGFYNEDPTNLKLIDRSEATAAIICMGLRQRGVGMSDAIAVARYIASHSLEQLLAKFSGGERYIAFCGGQALCQLLSLDGAFDARESLISNTTKRESLIEAGLRPSVMDVAAVHEAIDRELTKQSA